MSEISQNTCPACEYKYGKHIEPVIRDGMAHCLDCGTSWRQFGNVTAKQSPSCTSKKPLFGHSTPKDQKIERPDVEIQDEPINYPDAEVFNKQANTSFIGAMSTAIAVLSLLVLGIIGTLYSLEFMNTQPAVQGLHVEELAFEEIIRPSGDKVVRVKGLLGNNGNETVPVSRVAIVLRKANGRELARWYHASKVPLLKPGKTTGFVTAMAVNAPAIATVDAIID